MTDGDEMLEAAVRALVDDAGCTLPRARALVEALGAAASAEALEVVAGQTQSLGSVVDRRVAMLDRILRALDSSQPFPNRYEVGVIFRITPAQGASVMRTYEARYSGAFRARFREAVAAVQPTRQKRAGTNVFVFSFEDPAMLDYVEERLRRRGLTRSVTIDRTKLELVVDRDVKDRFGKNAAEALRES